MIYTSKIKTDQRSQEILPGDFEERMLMCLKSNLDRYTHRTIPWHWHDTFEIDYMISGSMEIRTPDRVVPVKQGDIVFINQGIMHEFQGTGEDECTAYAIQVDMHLLSGVYNSKIERKYILPMKDSGLDCVVFSPDTNTRLAMAQSVLNAVDLLKNEPFGYEMQVRSELSNFWIQLLKETKELRSNAVKNSNPDKERIKKMMSFVHKHYSEKITLEQIAGAAGISARECGRCFDRCLGMSPIKYITEYRLHIAAEKLLETDDSIMNISEACGFSSSSYFGKTFSEEMGCTPREFRVSSGTGTTKKR